MCVCWYAISLLISLKQSPSLSVVASYRHQMAIVNVIDGRRLLPENIRSSHVKTLMRMRIKWRTKKKEDEEEKQEEEEREKKENEVDEDEEAEEDGE